MEKYIQILGCIALTLLILVLLFMVIFAICLGVRDAKEWFEERARKRKYD